MTPAKPATQAGSTHPSTIAFSVILRGALPPTVVAGVLASIVLWASKGPAAGVAGLIGAVIAIAFFASGLAAISRFVVDTGNPVLFMAVGMAVYFAQVLALLGVLIVARGIEGFDSWSAGVSMLVCVVVWQVAQVIAWRRARVPVYDEPESSATRDEAGR